MRKFITSLIASVFILPWLIGAVASAQQQTMSGPTLAPLTRSLANTLYLTKGSGTTNAVASANTYIGANTYNLASRFAIQTFVASGGAIGTVTASGGGFVQVSGSGGGTLSLPASSGPPPTGVVFLIRNVGTATFTIGGNGANIDTAGATANLQANQCAALQFDGTQWWSSSPATWLALTTNGLTANGAINAQAAININNRMVRGAQTFTTTGTVTGSGASFISVNSSGGAFTLTLPATGALVAGQELVIQDEGGSCAANNVIIAGNGNTINGATTLTISTNYKRTALRYNGTSWFGG